ncbi:MAG: 16S rRNA (guanine(527)-N(7))-methyltransferase RsmG [Pseudomonadota bacterium]
MRPLIREDEITEILVEGSSQLGISVGESCLSKMIRYLELVLDWGARMNLTSIRDPLEISVVHFLDSLTVFKVLPIGAALRVIDIGTGAGFPGMVLKIADSSLDVALLDRNPKKIVFLKHVAHRLGLQGVSFLNVPLGVLLGADKPPEFDVVVSRAVSSDPDFLDSLHLLLHPSGSLISMTGPRSDHRNRALGNFILTDEWEGSLPFMSKFRRVSLYSRAWERL